MKIAFDSKRLFNNFTGLGNYSRTLVKNLQKYFPENEYHLFTPGIIRNDETNYFLDNEKFFVHSYTKPFKSYWRSKSITKDLQKNQIQIYHGLSNELPLGLNSAGIKSVITIHDLIFKIFPDQYPLVDRIIYDYKFKNGCKSADKIISISKSTKNDIIKFYNISENKIELIYQTCHDSFLIDHNLSDQLKVKSKYNLPENYILSVGSIIERKNLLTVVKALKSISDKSCHLIVVGNGASYKSKVEDYLKKNSLIDRVKFLDDVPNYELPSFYKNARISIYLSQYEGFGIPVLESLNCNTPVITSDCSSLKEFNHPLCYHTNPLDLVSLIEMVNSLMIQKSKSSNLIPSLEMYSGEVLSEKIINLYSSLLT